MGHSTLPARCAGDLSVLEELLGAVSMEHTAARSFNKRALLDLGVGGLATDANFAEQVAAHVARLFRGGFRAWLACACDSLQPQFNRFLTMAAAV